MGNSGTMSLGAKIGIIVGALLVVAVAGWIVKRHLNKRRTTKTQLRNDQRPMQINSKEYLAGKKLEGGNMYGIGAERGRFPGTTSSRSHNPSSSYLLAPHTSVVDWGDSKSSIHSASSSVIHLPRSRDGSIISLPAIPPPAKNPSPLRLNPSNAPFHSRTNTMSSFGGSYMPPLPSPRSVRSFANPQAHSGWVSPLDVHFSRPSTPQGASPKPESYFPRLQSPEPAGKSVLLVPTPTASVAGGISSEVASIVSSNPGPPPEPVPPKSPTFNFNFFDSNVPTRPPRKSPRSNLPVTSKDHHPVSRGAKGFNENSGPAPNTPQNILDAKTPGLDLKEYGERAIIRDSIVSKRSVSIYQPKTPHTPTEPTTSHYAHSRVASSVYSVTAMETILDTNPSISRPVSISRPNTKSQSRSRSTSSTRPTSSHTLSRTQDSLRRHSRKMSVIEKRRSRERDQMHYDPTSHRRDRSGSVQGRNVDFDRPRESPFSSSNIISTHSTSSSVSTLSSAGIPWQKTTEAEPEPPIPQPPISNLGVTLGVVDPDRLSVTTALSVASRRGRSASEASQSSMGFEDFYDSYYRQSVLASRASQGTVNSALHNGSTSGSGLGIAQDLHVAGVGVAVTSNGGAGRRPPPLTRAGSGLGVEETIVEVASPVPSPMVGDRFQRFPDRI